MDEKLLLRMALIVSLVGFAGLVIIVLVQKPVVSTPQEDLLTTMVVEILDVQATQEGTVVVYATEASGYIDAEVSEDIIGQEVTIIGRLSEDFFSIEEITV
ncbi:hypothetical protein K9M74_01415 [Candidatus Woesearchaeota archaeon]|nr:hypothetical protein [Candidatus Woesearchaeota archaeon]